MWKALYQRTIPCVIPQCRFKSSKVDAEAVFKSRILRAEAEQAKKLPEWAKREESLRKRYGAWNPTRKFSRQQISNIRELKAQWPQMKTKQLADHFNINPESIRRILKSKWTPSEEELASMNKRAEKRKLESQERKLKAASAMKSAGRLPHKKLATKTNKRHADGSLKRRDEKRPFTVGVGDLID